MMVRVSQAALRQEVILQSAADLLKEGGCEAVTMAAIATKTSLSRSALYQYFSSRDHILAELVLDEMADLANDLDQIASQFSNPLDQLTAWVHATLGYLTSSSHKVLKEISLESLPEDQRGLLKAMHGQFMLSLFSPLSRLTPEDPQALAGFVYSAVTAAATRIDEGGDFETEAATLERFVVAGVSGS